MTLWLFLHFYKLEIRKWLIHQMHIYMALYFKFRYVSCALGCPYEGNITPQKVTEVRYMPGFLVHGKMMCTVLKSGLFFLMFIAFAQLDQGEPWTGRHLFDHLDNSFILTLKT